jgi:hypothetical protein
MGRRVYGSGPRRAGRPESPAPIVATPSEDQKRADSGDRPVHLGGSTLRAPQLPSTSRSAEV